MSLVIEISLDERGQILIPETVRSQLGLLPGMTFVVESEEKGGVRLRPQPEQPVLVNKDGIWIVRGEILTDMTDIVQRDRERRVTELIRQAGL